MEINIEEKLPYTHIMIQSMRTAIKNNKDVTITNRLLTDVFDELGIK